MFPNPEHNSAFPLCRVRRDDAYVQCKTATLEAAVEQNQGLARVPPCDEGSRPGPGACVHAVTYSLQLSARPAARLAAARKTVIIWVTVHVGAGRGKVARTISYWTVTN